MVAKKGVVIGDEHQQLISSGHSTIAELADQLGVSRQTLHKIFTRRGWATKPEATIPAPTTPAVTPTPATGSGRRFRRRPPAAGTILPPASASAPNVAPGALSVPSLPIPTLASAEDLADLTRIELSNAALLAIALARDMMANNNVGPAGLKSIVAAMAGAADLLARCGSDLDASVSNGVTSLTVSEFAAADIERIRAEVEVAYHEGFGVADDAADDPSAPAPLPALTV